MSLFKSETKYEIDTFCLNCKILAKTEIDKNTEVKTALQTLGCKNCGVAKLTMERSCS